MVRSHASLPAVIILALLGLLIILLLVERSQSVLAPTVLNKQGSGVELVNLPNQYCPPAVYVTEEVGLDELGAGRNLIVEDCNFIDLQGFPKSKLKFLLPYALPFSLEWTGEGGGVIQHNVQVGDVNDDKVIDESDYSILRNAFTEDSDSSIDLDGDGQLTVMDLSIVRLNQGVSAASIREGE